MNETPMAIFLIDTFETGEFHGIGRPKTRTHYLPPELPVTVV
jgi:hypothetical protein